MSNKNVLSDAGVQVLQQTINTVRSRAINLVPPQGQKVYESANYSVYPSFYCSASGAVITVSSGRIFTNTQIISFDENTVDLIENEEEVFLDFSVYDNIATLLHDVTIPNPSPAHLYFPLTKWLKVGTDRYKLSGLYHTGGDFHAYTFLV